MRASKIRVFILLSFAILLMQQIACSKKEILPIPNKYDDLLHFFDEWREFQKPKIVNGIPDYSAQAMAEQKRKIPNYKTKLAAIDTSGWPIPHKVDYEIIRAEVNGLEFEHRVLRSWARNPIFYAVIQMSEPDVPAKEGPEIYGVLNVFEYEFPLNEKSQAIFKEKLSVIPDILQQAKQNLVEEAGDLWLFGIRKKQGESRSLERLASRFNNSNPDLAQLARSAKAAVDDFTNWLQEKPSAAKPQPIEMDF